MRVPIPRIEQENTAPFCNLNSRRSRKVCPNRNHIALREFDTRVCLVRDRCQERDDRREVGGFLVNAWQEGNRQPDIMGESRNGNRITDKHPGFDSIGSPHPGRGD